MSQNEFMGTDTGRAPRKRVGRGTGSGLGKTCGRGSKGEGSRTGGKNRGPMFEGGQFPFWMRLPKRGFSNFDHKVEYHAVDLSRAISRVSGKEITADTLVAAGLARKGESIKLVGKTEVKAKFTVSVNRVSGPVRAAIEAAGGTVTELDAQPKPEASK